MKNKNMKNRDRDVCKSFRRAVDKGDIHVYRDPYPTSNVVLVGKKNTSKADIEIDAHVVVPTAVHEVMINVQVDDRERGIDDVIGFK